MKATLPEVPKNAKVIEGDLVAKKDLAFRGVTFVRGNVVVAGVLQEASPDAVLIATGSIKAKAIKSGALLYAGKKIQAEVIYVEMGNEDHARLGAVGGIEAELFIFEDADDSRCEGSIKAKDKITLSMASVRPLKKLQKLLAAHAFGLADGVTQIDEDAIFDHTCLIRAIARGKPWRAPAKRKS